jgi:hypothetical protein
LPEDLLGLLLGPADRSGGDRRQALHEAEEALLEVMAHIGTGLAAESRGRGQGRAIGIDGGPQSGVGIGFDVAFEGNHLQDISARAG